MSVFDNADKYKTVIKLNGKEVNFINNFSVLYGLNIAVRSFGFTTPYLEEYKDVLKTFTDCEFLIGGQTFFNGFLLTPKASSDKSGGNIFTFQAVTPAHDLVKSQFETTENNPGSWENITMTNACNAVTNNFDSSVEFNGDSFTQDAAQRIYDSIGIDTNETIFDFLHRLGRERGLLLQGRESGNIKYLRSKYSGLPDGYFIDGQNGVLITSNYNYDDLAYKYRVITELGENGSGASSETINSLIQRPIFKQVENSNSKSGELSAGAIWELGRQLANAVSIDIITNNIYNDNNLIWDDNKIVSVKSEANGIFEPVRFLIESVKLNFSKGGRTATLHCILPEARSGGFPAYLPFLT